MLKRGPREAASWFVPSLAPGCGYGAHMVQRAGAYGAGVWFLVFGGALESLLRLLPALPSADRATVATALDRVVDLATKDVVRDSFSQVHVVASVACLRRAQSIAASQGTPDEPWDGSALQAGRWCRSPMSQSVGSGTSVSDTFVPSVDSP